VFDIEAELNLLIDILDRKADELGLILAISENQETLLAQPPGSERAAIFREMSDEKQRHIDEVLKCDAVFQDVFDSVKDVIEAGAAEHRDRLAELQSKIEPVLELDVKIRAQEAKNRETLQTQAALAGLGEMAKKDHGPVPEAEKRRLFAQYKKNDKREGN